MAGAHRFKPTFFWQGVFIVLPVAVLALVGLASLRRDALTAERDARERAAQNVRSLAEVLPNAVNEEIHRFIVLQNEWTMMLSLASQPDVTSAPAGQLDARIADWERDYAPFKLAER